MRQVNIDNVQEAGNSTRLPAGGYVCKITNVEDNDKREYLNIFFDVAYGDFKGYYAELEKVANFWGGRYVRSYKETALPFFKRMCSAINKSNPGFVFDGGKVNSNEQTLVGKYVGLLIGYEEYIGNDGSVKTRPYIDYEMDINDIKAGKFKIPEEKKLKEEDKPKQAAGTDWMNVSTASEDQIPFN